MKRPSNDWLVKALLAALMTALGWVVKMQHDQQKMLVTQIELMKWHEQVENGHLNLEDK